MASYIWDLVSMMPSSNEGIGTNAILLPILSNFGPETLTRVSEEYCRHVQGVSQQILTYCINHVSSLLPGADWSTDPISNLCVPARLCSETLGRVITGKSKGRKGMIDTECGCLGAAIPRHACVWRRGHTRKFRVL